MTICKKNFTTSTAKIIIFSLYFFYIPQVHTETAEEKYINVYNMSNSTIYVATYCDTPITGSIKRTSGVFTLPSSQMIQIPRAARKLNCTRNLRFSYHKEDLAPTLDKKSTVGSVGIGTTSGGKLSHSFYIIPLKGVLHGYSSLALKAQDVLLKITAMLKAALVVALRDIKEKSLLLHEQPHAESTAQVRIGDTLAQEEAAFVTARKQLVKGALEKLLGRKLNGSYIPTIACVSSGGGARALIGTLGFHVGAEQIGLLDTFTYDVGLSGGSWLVALWHQSNTTPSAFKKILQPIAAKGLNPTRKQDFTLEDIKRVMHGVLVRNAVEQPTTFVTVWGAMLANRYLQPYEPRSQALLFSSLYERPTVLSRPFPLIAAINGYAPDMGLDKHTIQWFEISPVEASGVGSWLGNASIPTWAFGRRFSENISVDSLPEYDMGQLMGISGSAFAATIGRAFAEMPSISVPAHFILKATVGEDFAATKRISVGKVPNFTQHVSNSIIRHKKDLRLVDAGLAFNIPTPVVMHPKRKADIMIICDMSEGITKENARETLGLTEQYARYHNVPFPTISYDTVTKRALSVFYNADNPDVPMVLYFPNVIDRTTITYPQFIPANYNPDISTLQFQYDATAFNQLSGLTEANVVGSKQQIIDAITRNIEMHNGFAD
jgi:hypothetical protein